MDAYSMKAETGAKETASSANDTAAATLQQMLTTSGAFPLHFLPTTDGSTAAAAALPWAMMPQYQMMVVPQSLLSGQGVTTSVSDGHVIFTPTVATSLGEAVKVERAMGAAAGAQSVAAILQRREKTVVANSASPQPDLLRQYFPDGSAVGAGHEQARSEADCLKPPKKPLTPYMTFSKMVWPQVKAANPHLSSVTEIGAVVGAMWRELDPSEKQRFNEQFNKEKVAYSEELHSYLKSTGLHASDLVKQKAKKKAPSGVGIQHNQLQASSLTVAPQASAASAATAAATGATLTSAGQQLIQTLLGLQPGTLGGSQDGLTSSSTFSQAWANQSVQQVLAQMGLSGQALFANSDGTISVDGNLLTIQGQPVQLAGQVASATYSDQNPVSTSASSATEAADAAAVDQSRGWTWHQPTASSTDLIAASAGTAGSGVVLYQLPSAAVAAGAGDSAAATTSGDGQSGSSMFYSVDAYGQLVRHEDAAGGPAGDADASGRSENQLQLELLHLQAAIGEKTREVDELRTQLAEAYATVEQLKGERNGISGTEGGASSSNEQPTAASSDGVAATVTVISPSTPS